MVLPRNVTPEMLQKDPSLLLHAKCKLEELTSLDGLVGAVVNNGKHIITSPNSRELFNPPLGSDCKVFLRSNLRFGEDDPLQWPQPYLYNFPHLACIATQPKIDQESPLWFLPSRSEFNVEDHGLITGIGKLNSTSLEQLRHASEEILTRAKKSFSNKTPLINQLVVTAEDLLHRLEHVSTNFRKMQLEVRGLQRVLLELTTCLNHIEFHQPMFNGVLPEDISQQLDPDHTIGAFTMDPTICTRLYKAKVRVWLIRPYTELHSIRILGLADVKLAENTLCLDPATRPSYPPIFSGAPNSSDKYTALVQHVLSHLKYPDPFGSVCAPPTSFSLPSPAVEPSSRQIRAERYTPYAKRKKDPTALPGGRNKFEDPISPFLPPAILSWRRSLERFNPNDVKFAYSVHPMDVGYVFPEPASFMAIQSPERQKAFFHSWLKYKSALIYRMSSEDLNARPMPNTVWRTLLSLEYLSKGSALKSDTRNSKLRETATDFLYSCLEAEDVNITITDNANISWNGKTFDLLGNEEYEEILWELAELNFRFELAALDKRATKSKDGRQQLISACFPRSSSGSSLLVPDLGAANRGLGSTSWKERAIYVHTLKRVMSSWQGDLPPIIGFKKVRWLEQDIQDLEESITEHYTKTFYSYFRRAPIVPRRLSHEVPSAPVVLPTSSVVIQDPDPHIFYDTSSML